MVSRWVGYKGAAPTVRIRRHQHKVFASLTDSLSPPNNRVIITKPLSPHHQPTIHLSSIVLLAAYGLAGISTASPVTKLTEPLQNTDSRLAPRVSQSPEPGIPYDQVVWSPNVVPELVNGFTTGNTPDSYAPDYFPAAGGKEVVAVYDVLKESVLGTQLVHTAGLTLQQYEKNAQDEWQSSQSTFFENMPDQTGRKIIAWRRVGYSTQSIEALSKVIHVAGELPVPAPTPEKLQLLRLRWAMLARRDLERGALFRR
ncbi:MAG: hypothetical protein M1829_003086 [Trizodia sp. TS-e1964]|nr:MAG: hypothetical protein M1829_003086 [Trizodia sp. TS-e1964]